MTNNTTAPERIGIISDGCGLGLWALATVDESHIAEHYVPLTTLEAAQARIAELERENAILRARATGAVYVCPECDIAGCKHYRAALQDGKG